MTTQYSIGTEFLMGTGPKRAVWIVTDMFKTYNLAGDLVKIRYGAKKPYIGGHILPVE